MERQKELNIKYDLENMEFNAIVQVHGKINDTYVLLGTGFLISDEGHIATCTHILNDVESSTFKVVFRYNSEFEFTCKALIVTDMSTSETEEDVTILQLTSKLPIDIKPALLKECSTQESVDIQTFGFPDIDNFSGIYSQGTTLGQRVLENNCYRIQSRLEEVETGFSGAPVWKTKTGEVIGMIYKFVIPTESLRNLKTVFITPASLIQYVLKKQHLNKNKGRKFFCDDNKFFEITWHVYAPFCPMISFDAFQSMDSKSKCHEVIQIDNGVKFIICGCEIYWFNHGIALWHLVDNMSCINIFEYSEKRKQLYDIILETKSHLICKLTYEILSIINTSSADILSITSEISYCLSLVNLTKSIWDNCFIDNALKLLSSPPFSSNIRNATFDELSNIESEYLKRGMPHNEYHPFGVMGTSRGYSSWAGVSLQIINNDSALEVSNENKKIIEEFVDYEALLQSYWLYCHHMKELCLAGNVDFVFRHYNSNNIKKCIAKLFSIGPTETTVLRLFKESLIETSRIKRLYSDLLEWA